MGDNGAGVVVRYPLGERLEAERKRRGDSPEEAAARFGITEGAWRAWVTGVNRPNKNRFARIGKYIGEAAGKVVELAHPERSAFCLLLSRTMDERGHSQEAAGEVLGVDQGRVARWESGQLNPTHQYYPALAEYLKITTGELHKLVYGVEEPDTPSMLQYELARLTATLNAVGSELRTLKARVDRQDGVIDDLRRQVRAAKG